MTIQELKNMCVVLADDLTRTDKGFFDRQHNYYYDLGDGRIQSEDGILLYSVSKEIAEDEFLLIGYKESDSKCDFYLDELA